MLDLAHMSYLHSITDGSQGRQAFKQEQRQEPQRKAACWFSLLSYTTQDLMPVDGTTIHLQPKRTPTNMPTVNLMDTILN